MSAFTPETPDNLNPPTVVLIGQRLIGTFLIGQLIGSSPFDPQTPDMR